MKLLMLGAGSVGGYFGLHLQQGGVDVTFLVRPKRAAQLRERGLRLYGPRGELHLGQLQLLESGAAARGSFDAVILSCKAYDLQSAVDSVRPYLGANTAILPLLNGLQHLEVLDQAFGAQRVLGGLAQVSATLDTNGDIKQLTDVQALVYGARSAAQTASAAALDSALQLGRFDARLSRNIMLEMWEKFVMLASLAGMTCLMRANVGEIAATQDGAALMQRILDDCAAVAAAAGNAPRASYMTPVKALLTQKKSLLEASMRRDMEQGRATEADQVVGDMLRRATAAGIESELLKSAYCSLQAYEHRRAAATLV
ncbi:MAG: ketopantoate reductase family protein [Steroidobacteraceae bacterium]